MIKKHRYPIIIIFTIVLLFFARLFLPEPKLFYTPDFSRSDVWNFNYPLKDFFAQSLKNGQLPFWSKDIGTGFPLFAEAQIGSLSIVNLIFFYFFPTWFAWNLSYVFIFFFSFFGCYLFFNKIGISPKSSLFSAFIFSFSGYFIVQISHFNLIQSASFLPWIFLVSKQLWESPSKKNLMLFSIVLSQQIFVGFLQVTLISLLGVFLYLVVQKKRWDSDILIKKIGLLALAMLMSFALAAPQILPILELRALSPKRAGLDQGQIFQYSYPVKYLATFLLPNFFGTPKDGTYPSPFERGGLGIYWENTAYVGILPLVFLLIAIFKKKKSWEKAFFFLGVLSLLLVLGKATPLSFVFDLPVFNNFRLPSRFLILVIFSIAALAGAGLDRMFSILSRKKWSRYYQLVIFFVILTIAVFDLFNFGFSYNPLVPVGQALEAPESIKEIPSDARIFTYPDQSKVWNDVFFNSGWQDIDLFLHFKNGLDANLNLVFQRANVDFYAALFPVRQAMQVRLFPKMLNASGVKYVISPVELEEGDVLRLSSRIEPEDSSLPFYYVYENTKGLDRFRLVSSYIAAGSKIEVLDAISQDDIVFHETVILETDLDDEFEKLAVADISVIVDEDLRLILHTKTDKKAILVIADSYYPGWEARVNNRKAVIYPANINQRALIVPAGENIVEFKYIPKLFYSGILVSIISITAFFFLSLLLTQKSLKKIIKKVLKQFKK